MPGMIFVNLPVADLARSTAFYEAMGATRKAMFSNDAASCMVFSDTIYVMLLGHDRFRDFTTKAIADATTSTELLLCLMTDTREEVDATFDRVAALGATDFRPPQDHGFMYGRAFEDSDGHVIELGWMDLEAAKATMQPQTENA